MKIQGPCYGGGGFGAFLLGLLVFLASDVPRASTEESNQSAPAAQPSAPEPAKEAASPPAGVPMFGGLTINGVELYQHVPRRLNRPAHDALLAGDRALLSQANLCGYWHQNLGKLNTLFKDMVRAKANPNMKGFTIRSDAESRLTSACTTHAQVLTVSSDNITVDIALPRNLFLFHMTTPSVFGSWADPKFSIDFDLSAHVSVNVPTKVTDSFGVGQTSFTVSNIKLDSQNVTGDIAKAVYSVYNYFGGRDMLAALTRDQTFNFPGIQTSFAKLIPPLHSVPANYHLEHSVNGDQLRFLATAQADTCGPGMTGTPPNCFPILGKE
jgi:hypothetical protein